MATYELIRNGDVEVTKVIDEHKKTVASVVIDGKYHHRFPHTSRVSKHLDIMMADDLAERLSGGSFFMVDGELVDFRDGNYNGFIHTDSSIDTMMDVIGYQRKADLKAPHQRKKDDEDSKILLRTVWDSSEISVPGYAVGVADFDSILSFTWNPFMKTVNSALELVRLICTNGAIGIASFLNTKVPLMNRWEEHLDIAARQIQNKVNSIVSSRVNLLVDSRASVADLMLLGNHAFDRLYSSTDKTEEERLTLLGILNACNVREHLGDVYRESVFLNKDLSAQMPGHLTLFDAYNIATELRSHTTPCSKSSDFAMDKFANRVLFDDEDDYQVSAGRYGKPTISAFSSPERAFYGRVN